MKTRKEIKETALRELDGNWSGPVIASLIVSLIAILCSVPQFYNALQMHVQTPLNYALPTMQFFTGGSSLANLLILNPISFCFVIAFLNFTRGDKGTLPNSIFNCFKDGNYGRSFVTPFLVNLFTALWTLLLVIPGIIKAYAYAMTYYIAHDNPDLGANDCINASQEMMRGHKWDLFVLDLSFIGWALLCILTFGIGFLWLRPYINTAHAIFYEELKAESNFDFQVEEDDDDED